MALTLDTGSKLLGILRLARKQKSRLLPHMKADLIVHTGEANQCSFESSLQFLLVIR